jgi:hypothetical protein
VRQRILASSTRQIEFLLPRRRSGPVFPETGQAGRPPPRDRMPSRNRSGGSQGRQLLHARSGWYSPGRYATGPCHAVAALPVRPRGTARPTGGRPGVSWTQAWQCSAMGCHPAIAEVRSRRFRLAGSTPRMSRRRPSTVTMGLWLSVASGASSSSRSRTPSSRGSFPRSFADHARECVVRPGRTPANLGRQPDLKAGQSH